MACHKIRGHALPFRLPFRLPYAISIYYQSKTSHNHCLLMHLGCNYGNHSVVRTTNLFLQGIYTTDAMHMLLVHALLGHALL